MTSQSEDVLNICADLEKLLQATNKDNLLEEHQNVLSNMCYDLETNPQIQHQEIYSMIQLLSNIRRHYSNQSDISDQIQKLQKRIKQLLQMPEIQTTIKPLIMVAKPSKVQEGCHQKQVIYLQELELDIDFCVKNKQYIVGKTKTPTMQNRVSKKVKKQKVESKLDDHHSSYQQSTLNEQQPYKMVTRRSNDTNKENTSKYINQRKTTGILVIDSSSEESPEGKSYYYQDDQSLFSASNSMLSLSDEIDLVTPPQKKQKVVVCKRVSLANKKHQKIRDLENQDKFTNYLNDVFNF